MENNKGSLSIEAALVIPIFVFFVLTLTNFAKMIMIYDSIQTSINTTAGHLSSQCVYLSSTGVDKIVASLQREDSSYNTKKGVELIRDVSKMFYKENAKVPDLHGYNGETTDYYSHFKTVRTDPAKYAAYISTGIFDLLIGDRVTTGLNNYLQGVAKNNLVVDLTNGTCNGEALESLGIVDGEDGIDFSASSFKVGTKNSIEIIVKYKYDPGNIFFKVDPIEITQRVYIEHWLGK